MSENKEPANLDLYQVQSRQGVMLDNIHADVKEIKDCLTGENGLVLEVDRLKRGRKLFIAVAWFVFTTSTATAATLLAQYVGK